jgi:hypothetical protein
MILRKRTIQQKNIRDNKNRTRGQNENFALPIMSFHSNNIPLLLPLAVHLLAFQRYKTTDQANLGLQTGILYTLQEPDIAFLVAREDGAAEGDYFASCEKLRIA